MLRQMYDYLVLNLNSLGLTRMRYAVRPPILLRPQINSVRCVSLLLTRRIYFRSVESKRIFQHSKSKIADVLINSPLNFSCASLPFFESSHSLDLFEAAVP